MSSFISNLQNTTVIEQAWFSNLIAKINSLEGDACAELQQIKMEAFAYIQAKVNALTAGSGQNAIVQALLSIPTDLDSALKWIENAITLVIQPYYKQYLTEIAQLAALAQQLPQLISAIENAAGKLVACAVDTSGLSITVPTPFTPPAPPPASGN